MDRREEGGADAIREDVGRPQPRNPVVKRRNFRQASSEHDYIRIKQIYHRSKAASEPVHVTIERSGADRIPGCGSRGDFRCAQCLMAVTVMVLRQRRPRKKRLETTAAAAPAGRPRNLAGVRPWQRIVAPFSGDGMCADQKLSSDRYPASYARPKNDAEHRLRRCSSAVRRLGQRKTVCVIGESRRPAKCGFDVVLQRAPDQPSRVRVLDKASCRGKRAGYTDTDARADPDFPLYGPDQGDDCSDRRAVILRWRDNTVPKADRSASINRSSLDLGAADIDADAKPCGHEAFFRRKIRLRIIKFDHLQRIGAKLVRVGRRVDRPAARVPLPNGRPHRGKVGFRG